MTIPRTAQDIVDHGEDLARRFEDYDPDPADARDPEVYRTLRRAVLGRSDAERTISDAVARARADGWSWRVIGDLVGTSGEAARQRYSTRQKA